MLFKLIPVFFLCMVKFVVGVPAMYAATGWGFFPLFLLSSLAGICGVVAFLFFETWLSKMWNAIMLRFRKPKEKVAPKLFTRRNRILVKILRRYGLPGLAFITPTLISIPVGSILAGRLFPDHKKVMVYLSVSVMLWSALLSVILTSGIQW